MEVPQNGWFIMVLLKMIWGSPLFIVSKKKTQLGIRTALLRAVPPRPPHPPTADVGPGSSAGATILQ